MKKLLFIFTLFISVTSFSQQHVTAPLVRNAPSDTTYAPLADTLLNGSLQVVLNKTNRNAIPFANRKNGMLVITSVDDSTFQLQGGITNSNWVALSLNGTTYAAGYGINILGTTISADTSKVSTIAQARRLADSAAGAITTPNLQSVTNVGNTTTTNIFGNNLNSNLTVVTATNGVTTLTASSARIQDLTGVSSQTFQLPNATTLTKGFIFEFNNNASGTLSVVDNGSNAIATVVKGAYVYISLTDNTTANGSWDKHFTMPSNASYGTNGMTITGTLSTTGLDTYSSNLGSSYTSRTKVDKNYVDSSNALNVKYADTSSMLWNYNTGVGYGLLKTAKSPFADTSKLIPYTDTLKSLYGIATQSYVRSYAQPTGSYLVAANNLADVTNITTARSNIQAIGISDTASMLSPYRRTSTKITNSDLANSTISGVSLGSNLNALSNGYGVTTLSYNGSAIGSVIVDSTKLLPRADSNIAVGYITPTFLNSKGYGTGSVTSVATGYGLSGGTITTTGTLIADSTALSSKLNVLNQLNKYTGTGNITSVGTITSGVWQGTAIADSYISSASTWNGKQAAYTNLTSIGSLTNGTGWLYNNGTGTFSYTSPTKTTVGLGNVENTALSTWAGTSNITTVGTLSSGSIPYSLLSGTVPTWNQNTTGTAYNITQYTINQNVGTSNSPTFATVVANTGFVSLAGVNSTATATLGYSQWYNGVSGVSYQGQFRFYAKPVGFFYPTAIFSIRGYDTYSGEGGDAFTLTGAGAATFASSVTAANATFAGNTITTGSASGFQFNRRDNSGVAGTWYSASGNLTLDMYNVGAVVNFTVGTGAATFSSSVTATSLIKSGGTSSQFLMADGSVNTSVLPSGAYLPLAGGTLTGALSGTSATLSSSITLLSSSFAGGFSVTDNGSQVVLSTNSNRDISLLATGHNVALGYNTIFYAGNNNFSIATSGALSGTSASFSSAGSFLGNFSLGTTTSDPNSTGNQMLRILGTSTRANLSLDNSSTGSSGVAGSIQAHNGGTTFLASIDFGADGATNSGNVNGYVSNAGTNVNWLNVTHTGAVTLGNTLVLQGITASSSYTTGTLVVSGGVGVAGAAYFNSTMNVAGYLTAAGGAGTSDKRLKDTTVFNFNLSQLDNLHVYQYHWNTLSGLEQERNHYSVFAQEVEKIAPDLVFTANDSMGKKSVNFTELHTLEIERLKQRISEQNDRIERLEKAVFILTHNVHNVAN